MSSQVKGCSEIPLDQVKLLTNELPKWMKVSLVITGIVGVLLIGFGGYNYSQSFVGSIGGHGSIALITTGGILVLTTTIIGIIKNRESIFIQGCWDTHYLNALYPHSNNEGICDLVFGSHRYGFACVVDGTGHNVPSMKKALEVHFNKFMPKYGEGLMKGNFRNAKQLTDYFLRKMDELEGMFTNTNDPNNHVKVYPKDKEARFADSQDDINMGTLLDSTYKPAMSFVQAMQIGHKKVLLTAQAADTMVVVEMLNKELLTTQKPTNDYGLGDPNRNVKIRAFDITGARRVIILSDGITEFITFKELQQIVQANPGPNVIDKLMAKAKEPRDLPADRWQDTEKSANFGSLKNTDHDDVGCVILNFPANN